MSDQAIGFLLEFRNEASEDLQQAVTDFDKATEALERAVDAAQAAFTFLEEGTGSLAGRMRDSIDSAVKKTGELRSAMESLGSVEVEAPDTDPIQQAMDSLGEGIQNPIDAGVEEVSDAIDDLNEKDIQGPTTEEWIAYQEAVGDTGTAVDDVVEQVGKARGAASEYVSTLHDMSDAALTARSELRKGFEGVESSLAKVGKTLYSETVPLIEEFGEKGEEAAANIASDTVAAYERLQESAERFFTENSDAFSKANDTAEVWRGFLATEEGDLRKVQDLLRIADKASLEPLVAELVEQLGDAALDEEFWKPIANNKNVDREFFQELRKQFVKEKKTPRSWWDSMTDSMQKFFWPVYQKQGEKASEGITEVLAGKLKEAFQSPIGQFVAAIQISNIITRIFGPALELLTDILGQALLPLMRVLMGFMESLRPAILALSDAFFPLFEALGVVLRELGEDLLPVFLSFGEIVKAITPMIVVVARIIGGALNLVLGSTGEVLGYVAAGVGWVFDVLEDLLGVLLMILKPVIDFIVWLDELTGVSKLLGVVISAVLIPAMVGWAHSAIPAAISAATAYTIAMWSSIEATTTAAAGYFASGISLLSGFVPALITGTAAVWSFTVALLANPLTWIVLAVVAAIGLLVGVVWLLWEPIMAVFGWLGDFFSPLIDWIMQAVDWFGGFGNVLLFILGPIGWLILALQHIGDLFDWIFGSGEDSENTFSLGWITDGVMWLSNWMFWWIAWIPGWVKWLLGLEDAESPEGSPEDTGNVEAAKDMVEGAQAGAEAEATDQPDWWKSMWGIEGAEEVADSASESFEDAGMEAGASLTSTVEAAKKTQEQGAIEDENAAMSELLDEGDAGLQGTMFDSGAILGMAMLEGMALGMFSIANAFPLSSMFSLMFGPYANVMAQPAASQTRPPTMAGVSVGQVDYEVDAELSGADISDPVVRAVTEQTRRLESAIKNSEQGGLDLDLADLKDIAEF